MGRERELKSTTAVVLHDSGSLTYVSVTHIIL